MGPIIATPRPTAPPAPPAVTEWNPGEATKPSSVPLPSGSGPTPPSVPGGTGGAGATVVVTPSLDVFAQNISSLVPVVDAALTDLGVVDAQPGAFYHADMIRAAIGGANGDAGLKADYGKVLSDLKNALTALSDAVTTMSHKYTSTEDLNGATVADLQSDLSSATTLFGKMITDNSPASSGSS
jgi:hypothetical protein